MKDKMKLMKGICVRNSIVRVIFSVKLSGGADMMGGQQIASFVIPLFVIVGWASGHELKLFFADFEVCSGYRLLFLAFAGNSYRRSYRSCLYS